MKPIFEEERLFLNKRLNLELPSECWRKNTKIYLDITCTEPLYTYKVENGSIKLIKNNIEKFKDYKQKTIEELIKLNKDRLKNLEQTSIKSIVDYINNKENQDLYVVSHSSGKDSSVLFYIWNKVLKQIDKDIKWEINFSNTSNDCADTYKYIKTNLPKDKLHILNPKVGFYQWVIKVKDYFLPSVFVRNCCSTYKEGQLTKYYDKNSKITMLTGVRKYESTKRAKYDYIMDHEFRLKLFKTDNLPKTWTNFAPIVEWRNEDIWLYIIQRGINLNPMYKKGFNRVGCLICPFQQDYVDILIEEYYPTQWKRWMEIVAKNYEVKRIGERLKWTLDEWQKGKWKAGTSKIYELITKKATKERIKEVSNLLGISEELAEKYFNRKCSKCGKKLNPTEVAMFLKMFGRYENQVDDREFLCKKHMCENLQIHSKDYDKKAIEFSEQGCNLF